VLNKFLGFIALLAIALSPAAVRAQQKPIRVNCGGAAYTDSKGQVWQADFGFNEGTISSIAATVKDTSDSPLFQKSRLNAARATPLSYTFTVPDGVYHVNLYFAETDPARMAVGARIFDVKMQGRFVFDNLDIFAEAGSDSAIVKSSDVTVSNGTITLDFINVVQSAKINAIEILPGTSGPQLTLNFRYPDGTPVVGNLSYTVSSSLLSFKGTEALANGQVNCALFANPSTLGLSMQFTVKATLADSAGHVLWDVNLGMNPSQVNLASVQNSNLLVVVQKL
jgi:Malectin domain